MVGTKTGLSYEVENVVEAHICLHRTDHRSPLDDVNISGETDS